MTPPPPFLIYALPRSRTFWLSRFLSYGGWECGHDQLRYMRGLDDVKAWLSTPCFGSAETAAAPWWRLAQRLRPDLKIVVVRRSPEEVLDSLLALRGTQFQAEAMLTYLKRLDEKLDQIVARVPRVLEVKYGNLEQETACREIFLHCLGGDVPWNPAWWSAAAGTNLQIDFPALIRYMRANIPALEKLINQAKQEELAWFALRHRKPLSGVVLQEEGFAEFRKEARQLIVAHMETVGLPSDADRARDLTILDSLDNSARLSTITARSAGCPVGYLVSVISPSVELPGKLEAAMLIMYGQVPGLGIKLARFALRSLRDRGVVRVIMRAGVRGEGPRLGKLFQALGAEPSGQLFLLDLPEGV